MGNVPNLTPEKRFEIVALRKRNLCFEKLLIKLYAANHRANAPASYFKSLEGIWIAKKAVGLELLLNVLIVIYV